MARTWLTDG